MTNFEKAKEKYTLEDFEKGHTLCMTIYKLKNEKDCGGRTCKSCGKWLAQEYHEPILDNAEHEYLSVVIKPFRDKINYITKCNGGTKAYICINFEDITMHFPSFPKNLIYKGMKANKHYTLEELGL